jgi:Uma2 family endonuclease
MMEPMTAKTGGATAADLLATFGDDSPVEIIHGEMVEKAMRRRLHGRQHFMLGLALGRRFDRMPGGRWPGGWWLHDEVHVQYEDHEVFCHDLCGYRRELHESLPEEWPCPIRPDWVCELLSPKHEKRDLHDKWQRAGVPYYWIVHPEEKLLHVYRLEHGRYSCVLTATVGDVVRAEPFDAVELRVSVLFGDEDDDE